MANYWVKTVGGSDVASGADFANAFATYTKARAELQASGTKGSRIKLVNDGSHVISNSQLDITNAALNGTSYADPGFVIEGVDSSGNPAVTTCVNSGVAVMRFFQLRAGVNYPVIRGIKFDLSAVDSTQGSLTIQLRDATSGPVLYEACHFKGYNDNAIGSAVRTFMDGNTTGPSEYGEIRYCIFENCLSPIDVALGTTTKKFLMHHNVIMFTGDWVNSFNGTFQAGTVPVNASDNVGFYHNTIYINENGASTIASVFDWGPAAGDAGIANFHSNYAWIETNGAVTQVFAGGAGSTATNTGTIGFNTVRFGPSVVAGDNPGGLYEAPWDDGVDPKASDSVAYTTAAATVFAAPTTPWTWIDVNGTGYNLPLPRDLRPLLNLTGSSTGGVPGALPALQTDFAATLVASRLNPTIDETVTLTFTLTNTGNLGQSVLALLAIPAGLTIDSSTPSQGSYNPATGVWTVGTMASGAALTLVIDLSVDDDQSGSSFTLTASYTSSDLTDTDSGNNSDSITIDVVDDTDPGTEDGIIPFIDVAPFFADVLQVDAVVGLETTINRLLHNNGHYERRRDRFREFSSKQMDIAALTTTTINMGGIQRARFISISADAPVEVSLTLSEDKFWPAMTDLYLGQTDFEILKIRNPSAAPVSVLISVVD